MNRNGVVAGGGGEENAWSSFLVSTAGHRNHDGGLASQPHGVFCLLPCTTVIYVLFLSHFLIVNSLRSDTMSHSLQHLISISLLEEIVE